MFLTMWAPSSGVNEITLDEMTILKEKYFPEAETGIAATESFLFKGFDDESFYDVYLGDIPNQGSLGTDWNHN